MKKKSQYIKYLWSLTLIALIVAIVAQFYRDDVIFWLAPFALTIITLITQFATPDDDF